MSAFVRLSVIGLSEVVKESHSGNSDIVKVSGSHRRCELTSLTDGLFGSLEWIHPVIPTEYWRALLDSGLLWFQMPFQLETTCVIAPELAPRLLDYSRGMALSNDVCEISIQDGRGDYGVRIDRTLVIKTKLTSASQKFEVQQTMRSLEQALKVAFKFQNAM